MSAAVFDRHGATVFDRRSHSIAEEMGISQPTVHRYIKQVKEWKAAGNVVPGLSELPKPTPRPRTFPVDPRKMGRFTEDDGSDAEEDE